MPRGDERAGIRYLALGSELVAAVVGLTLAGYWIDRHFGTAPWAEIIGAAVGFIGGMFNLIRGALGAVKRQEAERDRADGER
jgi:F0F1-type ATP synthase assembly protein I